MRKLLSLVVLAFLAVPAWASGPTVKSPSFRSYVPPHWLQSERTPRRLSSLNASV